MDSQIRIPLFLLEDFLKYGIENEYIWEPEKVPHMLVIGATGTGKTYFCKMLIGKICLYVPSATIYIADYKGDSDYSFIDNVSKFYRYNDCFEGVNIFYQRFIERQQRKDNSRTPLFLYFDEFAAAINSITDKKSSEDFKKKIANLLNMGRSYQCFFICSLQRPDAQFFASSRDSFGIVVAFGNLSEQGKDMAFHSFKDQILPDRRRGTGYMLESGANLYRFIVPKVKDMNALHLTILKHMASQADTTFEETVV